MAAGLYRFFMCALPKQIVRIGLCCKLVFRAQLAVHLQDFIDQTLFLFAFHLLS